MDFFSELRRRNVFKVASVYIITSWLILQIISVIAPALHLPTLFSTIVTVVLAIGLPVACIFAWAFELTPQGLKFTHDVETHESMRRETGSKINKLLLIALLCALLFIAYDKFMSTSFKEDIELSIAVLPFKDMSESKNQGYFGEGIAEEIINTLTRIDKLMVISRTSSFSFKDTNTDIRTIGENLNVGYILEGSVRKDGTKLRISAQLVDVERGIQIWSETYDRKLESVFEMQDELTLSITQALKLNLLPEALNYDAGMTNNSQAYELFIQARELGYQRTVEALQNAAAFLHQAIEVDPSFYLAKAQLYSVYHLSENYGGFTPEKRETEQERLFWALMSSPDFPLKHLVMGLHAQKNNKLETANRLFELAYQQAPNDTFIQNIYLLSIPEIEMAIEAREDVLRSNPESEVNYRNLIYLYDYMGREDDAKKLRIIMKSKFPNSKLGTRDNFFMLYSKQQNIIDSLRYINSYQGEKTQNFNRFKAAINLLSANIDISLEHLTQTLNNEPENQIMFLDSLVLLEELRSNEKLNGPQITKLTSLPLSEETRLSVMSFHTLLKGDPQAFSEIHQLQNISAPEFAQRAKETSALAYNLYAAILKHQGRTEYAKALSALNKTYVDRCMQTEGRLFWCPLLLYLDGSLTEQQQFDYFKNSIKLLNEGFIGEEIFIRQSPVYFGVKQHPEFDALTGKMLDDTFNTWAPSLWQ